MPNSMFRPFFYPEFSSLGVGNDAALASAADGAPFQPGDLLLADEAARILRINVKTLANWRSSGHGPRYTKIGGRIRYRYGDLIIFIEKNVRASTSQLLGGEAA